MTTPPSFRSRVVSGRLMPGCFYKAASPAAGVPRILSAAPGASVGVTSRVISHSGRCSPRASPRISDFEKAAERRPAGEAEVAEQERRREQQVAEVGRGGGGCSGGADYPERGAPGGGGRGTPVAAAGAEPGSALPPPRGWGAAPGPQASPERRQPRSGSATLLPVPARRLGSATGSPFTSRFYTFAPHLPALSVLRLPTPPALTPWLPADEKIIFFSSPVVSAPACSGLLRSSRVGRLGILGYSRRRAFFFRTAEVGRQLATAPCSFARSTGRTGSADCEYARGPLMVAKVQIVDV